MTEPLNIGRVLYLDGESAVGTQCDLLVDDAQARITVAPNGTPLHWPYDALRAVPDQAGRDRMTLRIDGQETLRIQLLDAEQAKIVKAKATRLYRRKPVASRGKVAAWAVGALASVALIILVLVPVMANQLADFLPPAGEKALGDATLAQIRRAMDETGLGELPTCDAPSGLAALAKMQAALVDQTDLPIDLTVHVLDHDMVNAFTLPGGHIILFRGLIDSAGSAEEVAAVFAHEIGHAAARDPTRIALRSAGSIGVLGLLFGDFAGGTVVLFMAERLIQANYSQQAEANADIFAHRVLIGAGVSPGAIGLFFDRLRADFGDEDEGSILQHLASHPSLGDRIEAARDATPPGFAARQILSKPDWQALQSICTQTSRPEMF